MGMIYTYCQGKGGVREVLKLAYPMVISMAADTLMVFTDRLFLSKISPVQMNAAMGGGLGMQMMIFFIVGLTGFSTALVAQLFGAGKKEKCASVFYQALQSIIVYMPIVFLFKPLVVMFFEHSVYNEDQLALQSGYFGILLYGSFFFVLRHAFSCYFSGIGRTTIVMVANVVALLSNVCINYVLIFGMFGLPRMEIYGAAIGSIVSMALACAILALAFFSGTNRAVFQPQNARFFDKALFLKLLKFGYPAGFELFLNFSAFTVLMHIMYSHSNELSTAASIVMNWDAVSFIPLVGLEIATTSLFGRYIGQQKLAYAHRSVVSAIIIGLFYSAFIFVLFVFIPEALSMLFAPDNNSELFNNSLELTVAMLRAASIYVLSESFMVVFIGALRGAGDTLWTMFVSVIIHWMLVVVAYAMLITWSLPPILAWYGIVAVILLFAFTFFWRYRQGEWKRMSVL